MNPEANKKVSQAQVLRDILQIYFKSHHESIFRDLLTSVKEARPWQIWQSILAYFRRARAISFFFRLIGWILTLLRTGTLIILTTALFFVILPIATAIVIGFLISAFLDMKKSLSRLRKAIGERRVWVFFALGDFGWENALSLAQNEGYLCLVVSPRWISSAGHGSRRFYLNLRVESENCYLVRRYFYLRLRKKLLRSDKTVLIY